MKSRILISIMAFIFAISTTGVSIAEELLSGNPMKDFFILKSGKSMRSSSADPDWEKGNADWRPFASNSKITIANLEGPGVITHIWMTISNRDRNYSRLMSIKIYYDGETKPSVESPIGDFFAAGHGIDVPVDSLPVQVSSEGRARNCFWPMPFKESAKIVITNENPYSGGGVIYWYVDWTKVDSLPADTAYFHAQYRQEYPAKPGRYLVMKAEGRGHYAGTVYSVLANTPGWIGEGDDFFYIDGENLPSIRGTGTEDYFSDAWGFRVFNQPYHGVTLYEGEKTGGRTTAYRWHLADPVIFAKSLKMEIEHTGPVFDENDKLIAGYGERRDHISTVAFWYQQGGGPNWESMPAGLDRLPPHIYIEAEKNYFDNDGKTPDEIKSISAEGMSGGSYAELTPSSRMKKFELRFELKHSGKYEVSADLIENPDMGLYIAKLDGRTLGILSDLNYKSLRKTPAYWGTMQLDAGKHKLTFEYQGPFGTASKFGIDGLYLRPVSAKNN